MNKRKTVAYTGWNAHARRLWQQGDFHAPIMIPVLECGHTHPADGEHEERRHCSKCAAGEPIDITAGIWFPHE